MKEKERNQSGTFQNAFQRLGLTRKESDVYFAFLSMGVGKVSDIAKKAGINRTNAYDILANLSKKGLVSISGKEPKQEYRCENPESF